MSGSRSPEGPSEHSVRFGGKALIESRVPQTPRQTQSQRADHALCRGQWAPPSPQGATQRVQQDKSFPSWSLDKGRALWDRGAGGIFRRCQGRRAPQTWREQ